jgi:hypothetical protein
LLSDFHEGEEIDSVPEPAPKRRKGRDNDALQSDYVESQPLITFNEDDEKDIIDDTQLEPAATKQVAADRNSAAVETQPLSHPSAAPDVKRPSLVLHYDTDDGEEDNG